MKIAGTRGILVAHYLVFLYLRSSSCNPLVTTRPAIGIANGADIFPANNRASAYSTKGCAACRVEQGQWKYFTASLIPPSEAFLLLLKDKEIREKCLPTEENEKK